MQPLRINRSSNDGMQQRERGRDRGSGRGRGSWSQEPSQGYPPPLRRPYQAVFEGPVAGVSSSNNTDGFGQSSLNKEEVVKKSMLSADAAEFVPKTKMYSSSASKSSLQSRLETARNLSGQATGQSHMYRQPQQMSQPLNYDHNYKYHHAQKQQQHDRYADHFLQYQTNDNEIKGTDYDETLEYMNTMDQLGNVMHSLTLNPGVYQMLVPPLVKSILQHLEYPNNFQNIISAIIQQSINDSNFRYSGARLCKTLETTATPTQATTYREILSNLCQEEVQSQARVWQKSIEHKEDEQKKCHGLILFLAELVVQMEDASLPLGEQLIQLINIILKKPAPNTAKHVCQALKLAGHALETNNTGCRAEMESMMRSLTELVTQGHVDSHVGRMVHSVHELRNGNWGQTAATYGTSQADAAYAAKVALDEPVFYGPDGNILSPEESQFLNDLTEDGSDSGEHDETHKDDEITDEEEEDMIARAYEEFLKTIPNKKK